MAHASSDYSRCLDSLVLRIQEKALKTEDLDLGFFVITKMYPVLAHDPRKQIVINIALPYIRTVYLNINSEYLHNKYPGRDLGLGRLVIWWYDDCTETEYSLIQSYLRPYLDFLLECGEEDVGTVFSPVDIENKEQVSSRLAILRAASSLKRIA